LYWGASNNGTATGDTTPEVIATDEPLALTA
jgi:hypothetical protein